MRGIATNPVTCEGCGELKGAPKDRLCNPCRMRRQPSKLKYIFTPEMDERILRIYADHGASKPELSEGLDSFARQYRMPRHVPRYRAQRLGITREIRTPWSKEDIEKLRQMGGVKPLREIASTLKRGPTSVQAMMERLHISRAVIEGYSREDVVKVLGSSRKTISQWIRDGLLKVNRDTDRVTEASMAKFIRNHPDKYSLKRVDEAWFKGMMFPSFGLSMIRTPSRQSQPAVMSA